MVYAVRNSGMFGDYEDVFSLKRFLNHLGIR